MSHRWCVCEKWHPMSRERDGFLYCLQCEKRKRERPPWQPRPGSPLPPPAWRTDGRVAVACLGLAALFAASAVVESFRLAVVAVERWRTS